METILQVNPSVRQGGPSCPDRLLRTPGTSPTPVPPTGTGPRYTERVKHVPNSEDVPGGVAGDAGAVGVPSRRRTGRGSRPTTSRDGRTSSSSWACAIQDRRRTGRGTSGGEGDKDEGRQNGVRYDPELSSRDKERLEGKTGRGVRRKGGSAVGRREKGRRDRRKGTGSRVSRSARREGQDTRRRGGLGWLGIRFQRDQGRGGDVTGSERDQDSSPVLRLLRGHRRGIGYPMVGQGKPQVTGPTGRSGRFQSPPGPPPVPLSYGPGKSETVEV